MKKVELANTGEKIPILGQGTWGIKSGKSLEFYNQWKESLRTGIELGITHIDTAEFYGHGVSERVIGQVIDEYSRDELFITSKLFPIHIFRKKMKKAAERSLKRLGINHFDLYLIHWPSPLVSIKKHMSVLEELLNAGKTRYIGVSNFSVKQFKKAQASLKKVELVNNQVHVNLTKQNHLHKSLPYYQKHEITMTAYSPLAHSGYTKLKGELKQDLEQMVEKHHASIQQIAIAWLINHEKVITIPKAFQTHHMEANAQAAEISLSQEEIELFYKYK